MRSFSLFLFVLLILAGCKKDESFPNEPRIVFKSLFTMKDVTGKDTVAQLTITFTDGDGNIGYKREGENDPIFDDPNSIYYRNFQVEMYEKKSGIWVLNSISPTLGGRIPYLTPEGTNKALEGEIQMNIDLPLSVTSDTIYYKIFIYDRTPTKSNVVESNEVMINT
jgi:hypothetical protein